MAKNEVAVKEEAALPAVIDFGADSGSGFEEADATSYAIPFLRMLQVTSDQCKKTNPLYIKGAEEGDFFNTVTEKLYKGDVGVTVVPCHYAHKYNKWAPGRGGFRGSISPAEYNSCDKQVITVQNNDGTTRQAEADSDGNLFTDTREHYVMIVNEDGTFEPALLALSGTQLKKSKKWMTLMQGIRIKGQVAPMFSQMYKLTPAAESNEKGSWAGLKVEHVGQVNSMELYQAAKSFREMVRSGEAQAAPVDDDLPFS